MTFYILKKNRITGSPADGRVWCMSRNFNTVQNVTARSHRQNGPSILRVLKIKLAHYIVIVTYLVVAHGNILAQTIAFNSGHN